MPARNVLATFLTRHAEVIRLRVASVRGSSPRNAGAEMFVAADDFLGTIGGGQLEYMAIDEARALLSSGRESGHMDVPLGPEIGQCCGGRVELTLERLDEAGRAAATAQETAEQSAWPQVLILGAGHVGRALADLLEKLPVSVAVIDGRAEELWRCTAPVELRETPLPEAEIRAAPAGSAFVVLTHDHALDFLLTAEALARGDTAYVGMIGSATKRKKFERFARDECDGLPTDTLVCPIGAAGSDDKRPEVIAAFVTAEVMTALTGGRRARTGRRTNATTN